MRNNKTLYVCAASAGTGKTFTLAAYYISLIMMGNPYRTIMAVTFTNKATAEMKERILNHLRAIARGDQGEEAFVGKVRQFMTEFGAPYMSDTDMQALATKVFGEMLLDYDGIRITTIDSFLQLLLSGLAHSIGKAAGYAVDLDTDHAISEAVVQLLTTRLMSHPNLKTNLQHYISNSIAEEKGWDIRKSLAKLARELFKETVQEHNNDIVLDSEKIKKYREACANWESHPDVVAVRKMAKSMPTYTGSYSTDFNKACAQALVRQKEKEKEKTFAYGKNAQKFAEDQTQAGNPLPQNFLDLLKKARYAYLTSVYTTAHLHDMLLLGYIRNQIENNQGENNSILLSNTARILSESLRGGDADFILEKAGLRYHHILLDEFQDTSTLQWKCFFPLVHEILSDGGTAFIVGDTKQGIYRWRNGDWTIMTGLKDQPELAPYYHPDPLVMNFRCREEIIRYVDSFGYEDQAKKNGGAVRVIPCEKEEVIVDMFDRMEELLSMPGAQAKDCLILTRGHEQSRQIIETLAQLDPEQYPHIVAAGITSSDSFLLGSSASVLVLVHALRYTYLQDCISLRYVSHTLHRDEAELKESIHRLDRNMPLSSYVEALVEICLCREGKFIYNDIAYLNSFLDKLRDYIHRYGSSPIDFLLYWDDKMHKIPMSVSENQSIRILTIHSSKGLEAKHVFIPFLDWMKKQGNNTIWVETHMHPNEVEPLTLIPITTDKYMSGSAYESEYGEETRMSNQDNQNLLYVALTRAADNLFVWTVEKDATPYSAGEITIYGDKKEDESPFSFASAQTIEASFHSENHNISFRQSSESESAAFGTLCHDILASMETREDESPALERAFQSGLITNREQLEQVRQAIDRAWDSKQMCDWFSGRWSLMREQSLLTIENGVVTECRPDRVMIEGNKAIVLDYKFGHWHESYRAQVRGYMQAMQNLGYTDVRGYLWFASDNKLIPIHPQE